MVELHAQIRVAFLAEQLLARRSHQLENKQQFVGLIDGPCILRDGRVPEDGG